jgi:hypothetical protein
VTAYGKKPPKQAYGVRLDGEQYQLPGQPPLAQPTKAWGTPLVAVAKANAAALERAFAELADSLGE